MNSDTLIIEIQVENDHHFALILCQGSLEFDSVSNLSNMHFDDNLTHTEKELMVDK